MKSVIVAALTAAVLLLVFSVKPRGQTGMPNTGAVALVIVATVYGITFMGLNLWSGSFSLLHSECPDVT